LESLAIRTPDGVPVIFLINQDFSPHAIEGPVVSAWIDAIEAGVAEIGEPWAEAITKQHEQTKDDVRIYMDVPGPRSCTLPRTYVRERRQHMRVQRRQQEGSIAFDLLDDLDQPIAEVAGFLRHLGARACSPNTLCAYTHDLLHFYQFLELTGLNVDGFGPPESLALLEHLRRVPSRRPTGRLDLVLTTTIAGEGSATRLAPATVNRIFAAISSFYEYLIVSGRWPTENPIQQRPDPALVRVSDRHRPFMGCWMSLFTGRRPGAHSSRNESVRRRRTGGPGCAASRPMMLAGGDVQRLLPNRPPNLPRTLQQPDQQRRDAARRGRGGAPVRDRLERVCASVFS
jgi:hypothetical protein